MSNIFQDISNRGILPLTKEYKQWLNESCDTIGKILPFQGIKYCQQNDSCQCKTCKKDRILEWPYERSLSANLLYLTGIKLDDINYLEVTTFEETLISKYLRNITEFWKYVTEVCLLGGDYGTETLAAFNNGKFDKKIIRTSNFITIKTSTNNQQESNIMNKTLNENESGQKRNNLKKKSRKFFQRTKFFGNHLYQSRFNKATNDTHTFSTWESFIFKKSDMQSHIRSNVDPTLYLYDYLLVSNDIFKEKFLQSLMDEYERQRWNQLFINEEILTFTRNLTQYKNKLSYLNLQYEQWTYYHQLGIKERIWNGRVSKKMAMVNSMCVSYGRSKALIRQRQNYYQNEIIQCKQQIEDYEKQMPISVDLKKMTTLILHFIKKEQYPLCLALEQQRHMLKFDAEDHRSVEKFYQLNPRKTDIASAKTIWKATDYVQLLQHELSLFKKWISLPAASRTMPHLMELGLTKVNEFFTLTLTNKVLLNVISTKNNEENPSKQMVCETIDEAVIIIEKTIKTFTQIAIDEKTKLIIQNAKFDRLPTVQNVIDAIDNRQQNMIQRAQYHMEQTIMIKFPENL
ncbi:unnamed protein product [Rotaria sp. Silwood2]|nr:unnamed protein product [Rotaria sp. Silwood2]CAF4010923.1 unnamed protein product [Rotaria sp. Silwood2]CAF4192624.1 unnamed protein product [Rotaria sp. Silwood2]